MTDKHVDEVLDDLDRALGVDVSASVAANVRTTHASRARARRTAWFPAAAAAAALLVTVGYLVRPRSVENTTRVATSVPPRAAELPPRLPASTAVRPQPSAPGARVLGLARAEKPMPRADTPMPSPGHEIDEQPLVSPSGRQALRQIADALRNSRATLVAADESAYEPSEHVPSTIAVDTIILEIPPATDVEDVGAGSTR
jgi:hypothetical protein